MPNPFGGGDRWADLAREAAEMLLASSQVIAHRTGRMAQAGPLPDERDRREFSLMVQEKFDAARESGEAMAEQMLRTNQRLGMRAYNQMLASGRAMMAFAASGTPQESADRQARLMRSVARAAVTSAAVSNAAADIARRSGRKKTLRPVGGA